MTIPLHRPITEFYRRLVLRSIIHDGSRVTARLAREILYPATGDQPPTTYDGAAPRREP